MTPYVITNQEEAKQQTERLYKGTTLSPEDWTENNWSASPLRFLDDEDLEKKENQKKQKRKIEHKKATKVPAVDHREQILQAIDEVE
ncbi:MAG TPA: hypothetical protein VIR63_07065, partial [Pontiella sp.]